MHLHVVHLDLMPLHVMHLFTTHVGHRGLMSAREVPSMPLCTMADEQLE